MLPGFRVLHYEVRRLQGFPQSLRIFRRRYLSRKIPRKRRFIDAGRQRHLPGPAAFLQFPDKFRAHYSFFFPVLSENPCRIVVEKPGRTDSLPAPAAKGRRHRKPVFFSPDFSYGKNLLHMIRRLFSAINTELCPLFHAAPLNESRINSLYTQPPCRCFAATQIRAENAAFWAFFGVELRSS